VEPEETPVARQWLGEHVPMALDMHIRVEELMEVVFMCGPCRSCMMRTEGAKTNSHELGVCTCG
jgi:hypothetical protein